MAEHNDVGNKGEEITQDYIQKKGYKIRAVNWRYQKAELDIIAEYQNQLIVIEVKTRSSEEFENPKEVVTIGKQRLIVKAANAFIEEYDIDLDCRFDIISIFLLKDQVKIEHIEDAFIALL